VFLLVEIAGLPVAPCLPHISFGLAFIVIPHFGIILFFPNLWIGSHRARVQVSAEVRLLNILSRLTVFRISLFFLLIFFIVPYFGRFLFFVVFIFVIMDDLFGISLFFCRLYYR